jgi:hypothetical protein
MLAILNKRDCQKSDEFLGAGLCISLALSQFFPDIPRYSVSIFPFLIMGIAQFIPTWGGNFSLTRFEKLAVEAKYGFLAITALLVLSISITVILLTNYTGYDVYEGRFYASNEEQVYSQTIEYLEKHGAQEVYAANPIFPALSSKIKSGLEFDTFGLIWLGKKTPEEIIAQASASGVDYIIIDRWVSWWTYPLKNQMDALKAEVRHKATLVQVIGPESRCRTEIYYLNNIQAKK